MTERAPAAQAGADAELESWLREAVGRRETRLSQGYQGRVHLVERGERRYVVKVAMGWGPLLWLRRSMLRREHQVYRKLEGFSGTPKCLGLIGGDLLVLEFIDGVPFRHAELEDRQQFFDRLMEQILEMHGRGVAHGDLKRKENLMVIDGREPCMIDLGAAVVRKEGRAPVNEFLFRMLCQFDLNAWVKLKYKGTDLEVDPQDAARYRRTLPERMAQGLKQAYLALRFPGGAPAREKKPPRLGE